MSKKCKQTLKSFFFRENVMQTCNGCCWRWRNHAATWSRTFTSVSIWFPGYVYVYLNINNTVVTCKTSEFELSWIRIRFKFEFHLNFPWNQFHEKIHEFDFTEKFELPWLFGLLWEKDLIVHEVLHFLWQFHHQLVEIWNVHLGPCSYQKHQNDL